MGHDITFEKFNTLSRQLRPSDSEHSLRQVDSKNAIPLNVSLGSRTVPALPGQKSQCREGEGPNQRLGCKSRHQIEPEQPEATDRRHDPSLSPDTSQVGIELTLESPARSG